MLIEMKGNAMKHGNVASGTFLVRNYNYYKSLPSCSPPPLFALHKVCVFLYTWGCDYFPRKQCSYDTVSKRHEPNPIVLFLNHVNVIYDFIIIGNVMYLGLYMWLEQCLRKDVTNI